MGQASRAEHEETTGLDLLLWLRPAWHADAACREHPEASWFSNQACDQREAKLICQTCLVLEECRSWALQQGPELVGVWGGLSATDRREARRTTRTMRGRRIDQH